MKRFAPSALVFFAILANVGASAAAPSIERYYCTQFGPFFIRFDDDKAAGVFAILPNDDLGAIVGALSGRELNGEWIETDNRGEIRLQFSDDWRVFDAEYNIHTEPGNWRSNWAGRLRPANEPASFTHEGVLYRCE